MSFTLVTGYTWSDGEVVTAVKLNTAGVPTLADGQVYPFSLGTVSLPSMTFTGDTDTGLYEYAANTIGVAANGTIRGTLAASLSWLNGDDSTGSGNIGQQAYGQLGAFSYQHFVQTRHNSAAGGSGNAWVLWLNHSATAGTSSAPGTGNTKAVDFSDDNLSFYTNGGTLGLKMTNAQGFQTAVDALSGTSVSLDFNKSPFKTLTLSGNTTFTTANLAAGTSITVSIVGDGTNRVIATPATWKWVSVPPTALIAGKNAVLTAISKSTTDASVVAAWSAET